MKRKSLLLSVVSLILVNLTFADFPADRVWQVDFDLDASVLGPNWQDEDDRTFFLIGVGQHALIINEGEIVWESPELPGSVTALNRFDFETGDGPEIYIAILSDVSRIDVFSGEDYEDHTNLETFYRHESHEEVIDERRISTIDYFEDALPDSNKRILFSRDYFRGYYGTNAWYSESWGNTAGSVVIDTDNDGELDVIYGISSRHESGSAYLEPSGGSLCLLKDIDQAGDTIRTCVVSSYSWWCREDPRYEVFLREIDVITLTDEEKVIVAAYEDTSDFKLTLLTLPDFEELETFTLDVQNIMGMTNCSFSDGNNTDYFLLCLGDEGELIVVYVNDLELIDRFEEFAANPVDLEIGQFDDDEDLELVVLQNRSLILFDIGVLSTPFDSFVSITPEQYNLHSPYPNPFNSTTSIAYSLPMPERVTVKIFDLSGREVATLVDRRLEAGNHHVYWNGLNISSGVYVCRMEAGSFTKSIKLALVR